MSEGSNSKQSSAAVKSIKHLLAGGIAGACVRTHAHLRLRRSVRAALRG